MKFNWPWSRKAPEASTVYTGNMIKPVSLNIAEPVISFVSTFKAHPSRFKVRRTSDPVYGDNIDFRRVKDRFLSNVNTYSCVDRKTNIEFTFLMRRIINDPSDRLVGAAEVYSTDPWGNWGGKQHVTLLASNFELTSDEQKYLVENIRPILYASYKRSRAIKDAPRNREARDKYERREEYAAAERARLTAVYRDGVVPCKECGMIDQHKMSCDRQYKERT